MQKLTEWKRKTVVIILLTSLFTLPLAGCVQTENNIQNREKPQTLTPKTSLKPSTKVEYPGSSTKINLPEVNKSLPSLPFIPYNLIPKPGIGNVNLDTVISVSYPRPPAYLKLEVEPKVKISYVEKELIERSAKFTFYLAEPLKPGTKYTVTVTASQYKSPNPNFSPYYRYSWSFTTINPKIEITLAVKEYFNCSGYSESNESKILL